MASITFHLSEAKHQRLRLLAKKNGVSLNKLAEDWASIALAQFDAETRFRVRSARGNLDRGLALLNKLDKAFEARQK